jgi:hypothetical protein
VSDGDGASRPSATATARLALVLPSSPKGTLAAAAGDLRRSIRGKGEEGKAATAANLITTATRKDEQWASASAATAATISKEAPPASNITLSPHEQAQCYRQLQETLAYMHPPDISKDGVLSCTVAGLVAEFRLSVSTVRRDAANVVASNKSMQEKSERQLGTTVSKVREFLEALNGHVPCVVHIDSFELCRAILETMEQLPHMPRGWLKRPRLV